MPGKYFDLDLDKQLGGEKSSDITVASQKAVKDYVDTQVSAIVDKDTDHLKDLKDIKFLGLADGQILKYDAKQQKWVNATLEEISVTWGGIGGDITQQKDLQDALNNKADSSDVPAAYDDTQIKQDITNLQNNKQDKGDYVTTEVLNQKGYLVSQDIEGKANSADLSTVATSGSYTDLTNKPEQTSVTFRSW